MVTLAPAKQVRAQDLKSKIVDLVKAETFQRRHYNKTSFEDRLGGLSGPLKAGKNAVRAALNELLEEGHLTLDRKKHISIPDKSR